MSLLIKALQKAEQEKNTDGRQVASVGAPSLELAPKETPDINNTQGASRAFAQPPDFSAQKVFSQQAASRVFAARAAQETSSAKIWLIALAVVLLLVLSAFYYYLETLKQPDVLIASAPVAVRQSAPPIEETIISIDPVAQTGMMAHPPARTENFEPSGSPAKMEPGPLFAEPVPARRSATPGPLAFGEAVAAAEERGVKVIRNTPAPDINPNLVAGYEAFNAGDDAAAQSAYRSVLQGDIRNVDALLGMAAIAARQGRGNDAVGWYGKVLEVEPRNSFAQVAMVGLLGQLDPVSSESRIKNLIALQPDAAHLHAALGNLYAEQNQWPQAQQAYFEAHRLDAASPEHAYNLAVSLDHMGKAALALQYYKQTRDLVRNASAAAIDRAALDSRIAQLE
ncbi:hypothetical protein MTYP_02105 [Methylophilaceae bacterium]|nr:hypothetical protein MTYP_02105 [Methylophilaceae bacterium]